MFIDDDEVVIETTEEEGSSLAFSGQLVRELTRERKRKAVSVSTYQEGGETAILRDTPAVLRLKEQAPATSSSASPEPEVDSTVKSQPSRRSERVCKPTAKSQDFV